jgi:hypothetical protein
MGIYYEQKPISKFQIKFKGSLKERIKEMNKEKKKEKINFQFYNFQFLK